MGRIITDTVLELWKETAPLEEGVLTTAIEIKLLRTRTDGIEKMDEAKDVIKQFDETGEWPEGFTSTEKAFNRRVARLDVLPLFFKIPVSVIGFGDFALVGYGGEAFTQYADILRENHPDLFILSMCNANGAQGYFPTAEAFQSGGYEAQSTNFLPELVDTLQGTALELIKKHKEAQE